VFYDKTLFLFQVLFIIKYFDCVETMLSINLWLEPTDAFDKRTCCCEIKFSWNYYFFVLKGYFVWKS